VPLTGWGLGLALPIERWRSGPRFAVMPWVVFLQPVCLDPASCEGTTPLDIRMSATAGLEMVWELWRSPAVSAPLVRGTSCSGRFGPMLGLYAALTIGAYSFGPNEPAHQPGTRVVSRAAPGRTSRLRS